MDDDEPHTESSKITWHWSIHQEQIQYHEIPQAVERQWYIHFAFRCAVRLLQHYSFMAMPPLTYTLWRRLVSCTS
jgi:hypothetical protein